MSGNLFEGDVEYFDLQASDAARAEHDRAGYAARKAAEAEKASEPSATDLPKDHPEWKQAMVEFIVETFEQRGYPKRGALFYMSAHTESEITGSHLDEWLDGLDHLRDFDKKGHDQ